MNNSAMTDGQTNIQTPETLPLVTVAIPTLNEERYITRCLQSIKNQTWPIGRMEVLIIDAFSTDGTRKKANEFATKTGMDIKILDNPGKIQARAINIAIKYAHGEVFVRMDAHSIYNPRYVETAVRKLAENPEVWNVGGYWTIRPANDSDKAFAIARSFANPFGGGNATYRTTGVRTQKFVDTVPYGAYPIKVFDKLGMYDNDTWIGEDVEFNSRILRHGKKILITPEMDIEYMFKASSFRDVWRRNYLFGTWLFRRKSGRGLRHFIPMLFVIFLLSAPVLVAINPVFLLLWAIGIVLYLTTAVFFILRHEKPAPNLRRILLMLVSFIVMHAGFGIGSIVSMVKYAWRSKVPEIKP